MNPAVILRILIGLVLLVSGLEKSISPYQNFLYVIQSYQLFPVGLDKAVAIIVPWLELLVGLFLVLGLWTNAAIKGAILFFLSFITIVAQALFKHLPIDECGCFGQAIHIPPQYIIIFDSFVFLCLLWLAKNLPMAMKFSLDEKLK